MRMIDALEIAVNTFSSNKMRTLLTILGIAVGIGAIVFLVSLGYGLQELTVKKITSISALTTLNVNTEGSTILKINDEMLGKLAKIDGVESVSPLYSVSSQVSLGKSWTDATAYGADNKYIDLEAPELAIGKLGNNRENEVLITKAVLEALAIEDYQALGKKLKVNLFIPKDNNPNETDEVTKELSISGVIKDNSLSYIYVPLKVFDNKNRVYAAAKIKVKNKELMSEVKGKLEELGLKVSSVGDTVLQLDNIFRIARQILFIFGFVALLVASIGMFNTLTISLLERTREIGIMKALGSTDKFVRKIFLMEAIIIGMAGGVLGVVMGSLLGVIINLLVNMLAKSLGGQAVSLFVTPPLFVLAIIIFSFIIGLLTGIYPARRAARLNPLDALRYE